MDEKDKVVVIHLKPGEPVKIGETYLKVKRWRDGKVSIEVKGDAPIERNLDEQPPESVVST